jgi:glucose-1-phosphate thymidylyltransferase
MKKKEIIGILPCAGLGLRMRPLRYPKELLPVSYERSSTDDSIRPKLSIEYSISAFKLAGIKKCYVVVPDWKPEIMRYLGNGSEFDISIAYLHNSSANGLADAVFSMHSWIDDDQLTCLALPDTQFFPAIAFRAMTEKLEEENADLVLGVFPTDEPQCFAPVELGQDNKVISIEDKPAFPKFFNAWGLAIWSNNFWDFFRSTFHTIPPGGSISETFHRAATEGLKVYGVHFIKGAYYDIGRIDHLPFAEKKPGLNEKFFTANHDEARD